MGIFDIDSGADNHLLNEQFHVFSKSPASVATALGDASNRSGHTVTASDVWGQEIPAFFYAKTQAVANTYKSLAKTNDLCRIGNSVAIFENGDWVVKYNSYTDIPDGQKFKNAAGDDVIRFHKNRLAYNLNLDNNAADDGLNTTAKIQGWDEQNDKVYDYVATAPKFVTQFVTSTDKIVDGIPSKGFGPFVMAGTTTGDITKVLPEGTSDANHYIANSFAGIIQFNMARTDAIYVHAFEYCGKTLKSAYSDIVELDEKISKISVTASGGIQDASTDAKTAGFSVTTETRTNSEGKEETIPVFNIETGSVTTGETKLVTGSSVKTYVDTTALAEGGSIAEYVENYVATNAKVSVNGQSATTITVAGTDANSSDLVKIAVAEDKDTDNEIGLTLTATVDTATVTEGVVKYGDESKLVTAGDAANIAEKAAASVDVGVTGITINNGAKQIGDVAISVVTGIIDKDNSGDGALPGPGGNVNGVTLGLYENKAYVDVATANYDSASKAFASINYLTSASDVTAYVNDSISTAASTIIDTVASRSLASSASSTQGSYVSVTTSGTIGTGLTVNVNDSALASTVSAASSAVQSVKVNGTEVKSGTEVNITAIEDVTTTAVNGVALAKDGNNVKVAVTPATYTSSTKSWTNETNVAKASDVAAAISDAVNDITIPDVTASTAAQGVGITANGHEVSVATATYTPASGDTTASWTDKGHLVTGATVEAFVSDETTKTLNAAKAYSDSLHSANLVYVVLGYGETLPPASADTVGKIYLVQEGNTANGESNIDAISGDYVEYMTRWEDNSQDGEYVWEKIGTTAADLNAYAKKSELAVASTTVNGLTYSQTNGIVSASVVKASTTQVGTVQLTDTYTSTDDTNAATGKSIAAAIDTLDSSKSVNGITVTQENGVITSVTEELITATVPEGTTSVEGNIAYVGSTKHVIAPEKFETAAQMPTTLTSWVADLSNLTVGDNMFYGGNLETFIGDLSSLTSGVDMFLGCTLDEKSWEVISDTLPIVEGEHVIHMGGYTQYTWTAFKLDCSEIIQNKGWVCQYELGGGFD